jgi:hypothetical protein
VGEPQMGRRIVIPRIEFPEIPEIDITMPQIAIPSININLPRVRVIPRPRVGTAQGPI